MVVGDQVDALLDDLSTISEIASAGVLSRTESRLQAGEIRPAAILFIDVVGFTELSRKLTSEQLAKLIDKTFRIFELTVKSYGGYLDKVIGDAGLYVFAGHPNFAPPCEAAVSAGLKILDRAGQVSQALAGMELSLAVRCGVSFGEVAKQVVGGEVAQVTVMGDTVNLAQRLESVAQPGTLLVDDTVLQKVSDGFAFKSLGQIELKGFGPRAVHKADTRQKPFPELRGSRFKLSPFIGRARQLAAALDRVKSWMKVQSDLKTGDTHLGSNETPGFNRLLVITGVQAVGKSRFALELVGELQKQAAGGPPIATATAHCTEYTSLQAFTAEILGLAGLRAGNLVERWDSLCQLAELSRGSMYAERQRRHLPLMAYVLECSDVDTEGIRRGGAAAFETGCRLAIRACIELAGIEGKQVLLVLEDLQWLRGFESILSDILRHSRMARPFIVIATARPEFDYSDENLRRLTGLDATQGDQTGSGSVQQNQGDVHDGRRDALPYHCIELPLLAREDGAQLMQQLLPEIELPGGLEQELHVRAAGLPYYYEEFARTLVDSGMVQQPDQAFAGQAALAAGVIQATPRAQSQLSLPADFPMPDDIRMLLLGRLDMLSPESKELAMRSSVLGRIFSLSLLERVERQLGLPVPDGLVTKIAELTKAGILTQSSGDTCLFEHVLTREAAYDSLLSQNKLVIHGLVADTLVEDLTPGSIEEWDILPQLVTHLERAGRLQEAFDHCCQLLIVLAQSGRFEQWDEWDGRAQELADRLVQQPVGLSDAGSSQYLRARGIRQLIQGELEAAQRDFTEALELVRRADDQASLVKLLSNLAMVAHREGKLVQAIEMSREAISACQQNALAELSGTLHANLGMYLSSAGDFDEALRCYEEAQQLHGKFSNKRGLATIGINRGAILKEAGKFAEAQECFAEALELARQLGDRLLEAGARTNLGSILHETGQLLSAREMLSQALNINREIHRLKGELINAFGLGEVAFDLGAFEEAAKHYERALQLAQGERESSFIVLSHCAMARVLSAMQRFESVEGHINHARVCAKSGVSTTIEGVADCVSAYYAVQRGDHNKTMHFLNKAKSHTKKSSYVAGSQLIIEIDRVRALLDAESAQG